ncbi:hypothetical protein M5689_000933 [Euphorbia peplus]|nr:hypothetical protein M5689_000933 [Euphorbia peplus]
MLETTVKFEKAFDLLEMSDSKYVMELTLKHGTPTSDDRDYVRSLLPFLQVFYDTTVAFFGSLHVTSNEYMKKVFGLGLMIDSKIEDSDVFLRAMAEKMKKKKKFGNILGEC